jgi:hypothetical protein
MKDDKALRIIDANCNRAREALRVIEDVLRFCREDAQLTRKLKRERHVISSYCDRLLKHNLKGLKARNAGSDPGRESMSRGEASRANWNDLLMANFRRAEESLRVLEEVAKLLDLRLSMPFKRCRFRVYRLEKACLCAMEGRLEKD